VRRSARSATATSSDKQVGSWKLKAGVHISGSGTCNAICSALFYIYIGIAGPRSRTEDRARGPHPLLLQRARRRGRVPGSAVAPGNSTPPPPHHVPPPPPHTTHTTRDPDIVRYSHLGLESVRTSAIRHQRASPARQLLRRRASKISPAGVPLLEIGHGPRERS
jgi:hypothetical protein